MQVLAVSQNHGDPRPYIDEEGARTAELLSDGVFDRVYLKADWSGAVILVSAASEADARVAVDSMPLVAHGVTAFSLTEIIDPPAAG